MARIETIFRTVKLSARRTRSWWDVKREGVKLGHIRRIGSAYIASFNGKELPAKGTVADAADILRRAVDGEY